MSVRRIWGVILQELYITRRSLEVIVDLFFFSFITIIVFGFVSLFISNSSNSNSGQLLLIGMFLWEIIRVIQYSISVGSLWNIWSRNLSNMFVTPMSLSEYITALFISSVIKALIIFMIISLLAISVFQFNVFQVGLTNLTLFFINLTIFSWTIGIILLGLIFRYGTRIQAFAWSMIFLFQPLTASFFPVSTLPGFLQTVAFSLPPTYVFEAARAAVTQPLVNWNYFLISLALNIFYFFLSLLFFNYMFVKSKESGQFARMDN